VAVLFADGVEADHGGTKKGAWGGLTARLCRATSVVVSSQLAADQVRTAASPPLAIPIAST